MKLNILYQGLIVTLNKVENYLQKESIFFNFLFKYENKRLFGLWFYALCHQWNNRQKNWVVNLTEPIYGIWTDHWGCNLLRI